MHITYLAHAAFLLTAKSKNSVLTDPYESGAFNGLILYRPIDEAAAVITISHGHADHSYIAAEHKTVRQFTEAGQYKFHDIEIKGVEVFHDIKGGAERGKVIAFVIKMDGVTICHLGDLGHMLTPKQIAEIGKVDVLLVPVGGIYTIDAAGATEVMQALNPKICIPMHYKTEKLGFDLAPVDDFVRGKSNAEVLTTSTLELTPELLSKTAKIYVLKPSKL